MKVSKAIKICLDYHRSYSKPNTIRAYESILTRFGLIFSDKDLEETSSEDILTFLNKITDGKKQQTKRTRYSHLNAFSISLELILTNAYKTPATINY